MSKTITLMFRRDMSGTETHTFSFPAEVEEATFHLIGDGGAGGGTVIDEKAGGGGGAGGQYAKKTVELQTGDSFEIEISGGTPGTLGADGSAGTDTPLELNGVLIALAKGGAGGGVGSNAAFGVGALGSDVGGIGDIVYAGGDGASAYHSTAHMSGGGGGGAGTTGVGGNASTTTGGTGTSLYGGNGGEGRRLTSYGTGNSGAFMGGGGGGGRNDATAHTRAGGVGGRGGVYVTFEVSGYYAIEDWEDLVTLRGGGIILKSLPYILMNDLDSSTTGYSGRGNSWFTITDFGGEFNGNGKTISDLSGTTTMKGLFSTDSKVVGASAHIYDLGVINYSNDSTGPYGAAFVSSHRSGLIERCFVRDSNFGPPSSGSASDNWGVFAGLVMGADIRDCYTRNCEIQARNWVGGFAGVRNHGANSTTGRNVYAASVVNGWGSSAPKMGLLGQAITVSHYWHNAFFDEDVAGTSDDGNATYHLPKTTAEMKNKDTYTDWDFDDVWDIRPDRNDGYPYLRWEYPDETVVTGAAFLLRMV